MTPSQGGPGLAVATINTPPTPATPPAGLAAAALTQAAARALLAPLQAAGIAAPAADTRIGTPPTAVRTAMAPTAPAPAAPALAENMPAGEPGVAENPYEAVATWNAAWGTPLLTVCPARDAEPPEQMRTAMGPAPLPAAPAAQGGVATAAGTAVTEKDPSLPATDASATGPLSDTPAATMAPGKVAVAPAPPAAQGGVAAATDAALSEKGPSLPAADASAASARIDAPGTTVAPVKVAMLPAAAPAKPAVADNVPAAIAHIRGVQIVYNGQRLDLLTAPVLLQGISMAPLREIFEHSNGTLYWYAADKRVEAKNAQVDMKLQIGHPQAQVNGQTKTLELAPFIKQGRTMVPLQFIADTLNVTISFNPDSGQIVISSNQF
jgi:hypothetical protein